MGKLLVDPLMLVEYSGINTKAVMAVKYYNVEICILILCGYKTELFIV